MTIPTSLKLKNHINQKQDNTNYPLSLKKRETPKQSEVEFPFEGENDIEREIERSRAQLTSRVLERTIGLPGDIASLMPQWFSDALGLPTSENLKKISERLTSGYTSPKTSMEEKGGELLGDIASFSIGGAGKSTLGTIGKVIGIPLAGALAKEGVEFAGGSESAQEKTKLGVMLLGTLQSLRKGIMGGGTKQFGYKSLNEARKAIPKGALADATTLEKKLISLENSLKKGVTGAHTSESERVINEIKGHIKDGKIEVERIPKIREDINKLIENQKGFQIGGPPKNIRKASVRNLQDVKNAVIQAGNRWGRGNSPEFLKSWKEGNEALAVFYKSREISNFLKKHSRIKSPVVKTMLGIGAYHHPLATAGLHVAKTIASPLVSGSVGIPYRFLASPTIRNLYLRIISEASKGNAQSVSRLSQKLEHIVDKENQKKKSSGSSLRSQNDLQNM